jgi:hypothetical protein
VLTDRINQDYINAMKSKDGMTSSTLSFLRAQLKNVMIENQSQCLDDVTVITIIKKQVKQRQESIKQFQAGGRVDLVDKESAELNILKSYLPEDLPEHEIRQCVLSVVKELSASSLKDLGQVMRRVVEQTQGRADNRAVSDIVKKVLSNI